MNKIVSVIIAVYNGEKEIIQTLNHLKFNWIKEIIIVNDASNDNTKEELKKFTFQNNENLIKVYNLEKNQGKGSAIEFGVEKSSGEIILLLDADLKESVVECEKLVRVLIKGKNEVAIAIIPIRAGGFGVVRKTAEIILYLFTKKKMEAPLSGQRAIKKEIANKMRPFSKGFGLELGMDIYILNNNISYVEIECDFNHNLTRKNLKGFLHRGKQLIDIFNVFLKELLGVA